MRFVIEGKKSGLCVWTQTDGGLVYREKKFEPDLSGFDETRLTGLLLLAEDEDFAHLVLDAKGHAKTIAKLLQDFLGTIPPLEEPPVIRVPLGLRSILFAGPEISVREFVERAKKPNSLNQHPPRCLQSAHNTVYVQVKWKTARCPGRSQLRAFGCKG